MNRAITVKAIILLLSICFALGGCQLVVSASPGGSVYLGLENGTLCEPECLLDTSQADGEAYYAVADEGYQFARWEGATTLCVEDEGSVCTILQVNARGDELDDVRVGLNAVFINEAVFASYAGSYIISQFQSTAVLPVTYTSSELKEFNNLIFPPRDFDFISYVESFNANSSGNIIVSSFTIDAIGHIVWKQLWPVHTTTTTPTPITAEGDIDANGSFILVGKSEIHNDGFIFQFPGYITAEGNLSIAGPSLATDYEGSLIEIAGDGRKTAI